MKNFYLALSALLVASGYAHAAPKKSGPPADMLGKWRWSTLSVSNYENTTTGAIDGGGGMSMDFNFTKDGRFTSNFYMKVRTYSLVSEANTYCEGTVTWNNGTFDLHPTKGHYLGWYAGKKKTDRDMTAAERRKNTHYFYKWVNQDSKRVLMLGQSPSSLAPYKRDR